MAETVQERLRDEDAWLVVKRNLYYAPNDCGYTGIRDLAGRYTESEARARSSVDSGVTAVKLTDAPEFSKACYEDLAIAHMRQKYGAELTKLRAERDALMEALTAADNFRAQFLGDDALVTEIDDPNEFAVLFDAASKASRKARDIRNAIEAAEVPHD